MVKGSLTLALLLGALAFAAPATPRDSLGSGESRPWAQGVPLAEQQAAAALFEQGNSLLKDSVLLDAANKYREALTHWDHPAIHYNLVLALVNLDQPIEVDQQLDQAMRYGPAPLGEDKYQQAKAYKLLVEKQLAKVEIHCQVPGAKVVMDGQPLFTAPGEYQGIVRAGPHTIVASREGYLTRETSPNFAPGQLTQVSMQLYNTDDLTQYQRRWSAWVPWTVLGAGVAVAGGSVFIHQTARNDFKSFDQAITACGGCIPTPAQNSQLSQGHTLQTTAVAGYFVGGAAIATGATLLYLNRLQAYRVDPESLEKSHKDAAPSVAVAPIVAPGTGGMIATLRF